MPGREDFGVVRSRALTDARVQRAAALYEEAGIAKKPTSVAAVLGHIALLGLYLSRESDDGVLPGDPAFAFGIATGCGGRSGEKAVRALANADLLVSVGARFRLRGFADAYRPLLDRRARDRERKAEERQQKAAGADDTPPATDSRARDSPADRPQDIPRTLQRMSECTESAVPSESFARTAVASLPETRRTVGEAPMSRNTRTDRSVCCGSCRNGLLLQRGGRPRCCSCPQGRIRARAMARSYGEERAQVTRAARARTRSSGDVGRTHEAESISTILGRILPTAPSGARCLARPGA